MGGEGHRCEWRETAEKLEAEVRDLRGELASMASTLEKLQRHVFGKRSDKMPRVADAISDPDLANAERIAALQLRRENAEKKRQLVTRRIEHKIPEEQKVCPKCGGHDFSKLGVGKMTEEYELVPAMVERRLHVQEKLRCRCGETILTAPAPTKVFDKALGGQVNDSTLGDLFHRAAELVEPLYDRLLKLISGKEIVLADETTQRVQAKGKTRTAWLWSFIGRDELERELIAYVFTNSRSGDTPVAVLGETKGKLVADAYSGYNKVTAPGGRERAGCLAHLRRRFFDAQSAVPDAAKKAIGFILDVYRIERAVLDADLLGTPEHLEMRQTQSKAVMNEFRTWLLAEQDRHPPRGPMGEAISYALGQWNPLTLFLTDPHLPIDNNASERALRVAALGRKNFLFVGSDEAGENLAGLYSLIATCEVNGVNPVSYLADVLLRVQTHPASRIDELLPHNWQPPQAQPST